VWLTYVATGAMGFLMVRLTFVSTGAMGSSLVRLTYVATRVMGFYLVRHTYVPTRVMGDFFVYHRDISPRVSNLDLLHSRAEQGQVLERLIFQTVKVIKRIEAKLQNIFMHLTRPV